MGLDRRKKKKAGLGRLHDLILTHLAKQSSQPLIFFQRLIFAMGSGKKEATRRVRQNKTGDGLNNVRTKGENFYR